MELTNFIDWNYLKTFTGLITMICIIVQFSKNYVDRLPIRIPTQIYTYIVSIVVMCIVEIFEVGGNGLTISEAFLILFNGLIVSLAANGSYEAVNKIFKTS